MKITDIIFTNSLSKVIVQKDMDCFRTCIIILVIGFITFEIHIFTNIEERRCVGFIQVMVLICFFDGKLKPLN